ncbi:unnamed protein product [Effrenium voratum]|uniref:Uncharacterized protein n=1 Tax=Effrenium voratum TaxID=2562239 RepID=A0AA36N0G7_9DINO|nr:unnamed protein product [Effrenium voratum]
MLPCKSAKHGLIFITLGAAATLLGFFFVDAAATQSATGLRGGDRAVLELVLERYKVLARNVTMRVEAAERAVMELRRSRTSEVAPAQPDSPQEAKPEVKEEKEESKEDTKGAEGGSEGAGAEGDAATDPPFQFPDLEDPEETEEERAKRQEAEEQLQNSLILYNKTTGVYRRWRGDFKCANRVPPLPDGEAVECTPGFDAPCCSALGWCGRSADHCKCEMCSDYRHKAKISFQSMRLHHAKRECETIAADLGEFTSPEDCAHSAVNDAECGKMIMYSFNYPNWGCRCCAMDTPTGDEEKPEWNVYSFEVSEEIL